MRTFDAILFDVGGVLLTNGWDHAERAAAVRQFDLDAEGFEVRHRAAFDAWERGQMVLNAYLEAVIFNQPRAFSREEFFSFMLAQSKLLPGGAMEILQEIAATGSYLVGALNNEPRATNEYRFRRFGLCEIFDVALSSCYVGLRKPEAAMYRCAIDILGRPPERILFIDDREENVAGAAAAGIKAIRFEGVEGLRRTLAELGA